MNIAKVVSIVKQFEVAEPAVLNEIKSLYDTFGPEIVKFVPSLGGLESELGLALDFLLSANGKVFPLLDKALELLSSLKVPA